MMEYSNRGTLKVSKGKGILMVDRLGKSVSGLVLFAKLSKSMLRTVRILLAKDHGYE